MSHPSLNTQMTKETENLFGASFNETREVQGARGDPTHRERDLNKILRVGGGGGKKRKNKEGVPGE